MIGVFQETEEIIGMPTNVHIDKRALLWTVTTTNILELSKSISKIKAKQWRRAEHAIEKTKLIDFILSTIASLSII